MLATIASQGAGTLELDAFAAESVYLQAEFA
jgi:hypothetical protein